MAKAWHSTIKIQAKRERQNRIQRLLEMERDEHYLQEIDKTIDALKGEHLTKGAGERIDRIVKRFENDLEVLKRGSSLTTIYKMSVIESYIDKLKEFRNQVEE